MPWTPIAPPLTCTKTETPVLSYEVFDAALSAAMAAETWFENGWEIRPYHALREDSTAVATCLVCNTLDETRDAGEHNGYADHW